MFGKIAFAYHLGDVTISQTTYEPGMLMGAHVHDRARRFVRHRRALYGTFARNAASSSPQHAGLSSRRRGARRLRPRSVDITTLNIDKTSRRPSARVFCGRRSRGRRVDAPLSIGVTALGCGAPRRARCNRILHSRAGAPRRAFGAHGASSQRTAGRRATGKGRGDRFGARAPPRRIPPRVQTRVRRIAARPHRAKLPPPLPPRD